MSPTQNTLESSSDVQIPHKGGFADLKTRFFSAVVLGLLALGALVYGGPPFTLFWLVAAVAILWEWQRLIGGGRFRARFFVGGVFLAEACALAAQLALEQSLALLLAGALIVALIADRGLRWWAGGGVVYAGALILAICAIRPPMPPLLENPYALRAIVWLFAVVWGTDVLAYFGGRLIGGPKLWPRVSAGKTWSGSLVGAFGGALLGLAVAFIHPRAPVAVGPMLIVGLLASACAQAGDLFESAVKRRFNVKDSSWLIPGHGGVMDRLDGFLAAAVFVAVLGLVRAGPESVAEGLFLWS